MGNKITKEQIDEIVKNSTFHIQKVFDKCTVVSMRLPNGFILVESSACVDPKNFDYNLGQQICKEKLIGRIGELEGYRLQSELHSNAEETQFLNCKIVVTNIYGRVREGILTVGRVYKIDEGHFKGNDNVMYPIAYPLRSVNHLKEYFSHTGDFSNADIDFTVIVE